MNSLKKVNKIYNEENYNDLMNMTNNKKNKIENDDDNFWDIYQSDEDDLSNNLNLSGSSKNNAFNNNFRYKIKSIYNQYAKPKKEKIYNKYNVSTKSKITQSKESKKRKNKSVDISLIKPKIKIKSKKVDDLSVFNRNQKWLKTRNDNINKVKQKLIKKQKEELNVYKMYNKYITKPKELDKYYIFNEENSVKYRPENLNFFIRLTKLRQEKMTTPMNIHTGKINLLRLSHYSGIKDRNITTREMDKCMKYIHDNLKGKK